MVLGLELGSFWSTVNTFVDNNRDGQGEARPIARQGTRLIGISAASLGIRANYQDFQKLQVVDVDLAADAQSTLPLLIQEVRSALTADRRRAIEARGAALRSEWQRLQADALAEARRGWDLARSAPAGSRWSSWSS